jgi:integrase/recombinase XerC
MAPTWEQFLESFSASRRIAETTLYGYRQNLGYFLKFWQGAALLGPCDVQSEHLCEFYRAQKNAPGISAATAGARMRSLLIMLRWAVRQGVLLVDPSKGLRIPKPCRPIPVILTQQQVSLLLEAPKRARRGFIRVRDRALLEILYGTGLRRGEVVGLNLDDLDLAERTVRIRGGKGKDRLIPFGEEVAKALSAYLDWIQPRHCVSGETALFLSLHGERMKRGAVSLQLQRYGLELGIPGVTPHALRRAVATHLLENGANIVDIKKLLGHEDINSTMTYTQVFPVELIRSHRRSHPRAHRRRDV